MWVLLYGGFRLAWRNTPAERSGMGYLAFLELQGGHGDRLNKLESDQSGTSSAPR